MKTPQNPENHFYNELLTKTKKTQKSQIFEKSLTNLKIAKLEDNYKNIKYLDFSENYSIVLSYKSLKKYLCITSYIRKDKNEIKKEFENFENLKKIIKKKENPILLKYEEIFIEKNSLNLKKIQIVKIYEEIEYMLFNQYYLKQVDLKEKHVLKHYEENEILKIFKDMIKVIKIFREENLGVSFWQFFIFFNKNSYKLFVSGVKENGIEDFVSLGNSHFEPDCLGIKNIENFKKIENQKNLGNLTKIENQKNLANLKNNKEIENTKIPKNNKKRENAENPIKTKNTQNAENSKTPEIPKNPKTQILIKSSLKFAALLNYGFFKEVVGAYHNFNPKNIEKLIYLNKQGKISGFKKVLDLLIKILLKEQKSDILKKSENFLEKNLDLYYNTLFVFRNNEIFLADQPIFKFIRKVSFEINLEIEDVSKIMSFIGKKLKKKKNLLSLNLKFRNCTLFTYNIVEICESLKNMKNLQNFHFNFSENNLDDNFIEKLQKNLHVENLQIFELILNDTRITNKSFEKVLKSLKNAKNLQILNIEIMNKE